MEASKKTKVQNKCCVENFKGWYIDTNGVRTFRCRKCRNIYVDRSHRCDTCLEKKLTDVGGGYKMLVCTKPGCGTIHRK